MCAFTYLRMGQQLFQPEIWRSFVSFVRKLAQGQGTLNSWEQEHMDTESFVHLTVPLVKEAAASMHYLDLKDAGCSSTYSVLYFVLKGLVCRVLKR